MPKLWLIHNEIIIIQIRFKLKTLKTLKESRIVVIYNILYLSK